MVQRLLVSICSMDVLLVVSWQYCRSETGTLVYHVVNTLLWFRTIQIYPLIYYTVAAEFGSMVQNLTV